MHVASHLARETRMGRGTCSVWCKERCNAVPPLLPSVASTEKGRSGCLEENIVVGPVLRGVSACICVAWGSPRPRWEETVDVKPLQALHVQFYEPLITSSAITGEGEIERHEL